jgi:hypothetical protein
VRNGCEKENCTIDNATTYIVPATSAWPAEAQAIVDAAGATESVGVILTTDSRQSALPAAASTTAHAATEPAPDTLATTAHAATESATATLSTSASVRTIAPLPSLSSGGSTLRLTALTGQPNGGLWRDTAGSQIEAHGGAILKVNGLYHWYGASKKLPRDPASGKPCTFYCSLSIRLYTSTDLVNWSFVTRVFNASEIKIDPKLKPYAPTPPFRIERPKVSKLQVCHLTQILTFTGSFLSLASSLGIEL